MLDLDIQKEGNLAEHLQENRIPLKMSCGGNGSCKTCRVVIDGQQKLACQTQVKPGNYELVLPTRNVQNRFFQTDVACVFLYGYHAFGDAHLGLLL